jgi:integrase/recombinase XerD
LIAGDVPGLIKEKMMTTLRQRMDDAMVLRGFAQRTRESYLAAVTALAKHYHRPPDSLTSEEVQAYLLHLIVKRQLANTGVRTPGSGLAKMRFVR